MKCTWYPKIFFLLLAFAGTQLFAQKVNVQAYLDKYPQQPFVYLNKSEQVKITVKDKKFSVIEHHHEELLILKSNLNSIRSKKVRTNAFIDILNLKAYIYVYNGKSHSKSRLTSIDLKSENDGDETFYDDDKFYYIHFSEAKEGDIITIDYDTDFKEPRFFGAFFFSDYYPSITNSLTVSVPLNTVKLNVLEVNNQNIKIKSTIDSTKKIKTYTWSSDSVEALTDEYMDGSFRSKSSFVLMNIEYYKLGDSTVALGGKLDNLYSWYTSLLKNVDLSKDAPLHALVDSLIKDKPTEMEKLKTIFYWVQDKIAYLAYEDGLNGYIPREAAVVFKQKFGDCKDMSNLIVRMCKIAGLPVYPAWIGTRDIPYQFSEFPAAFCANHMIAVYISGTDTIFLDGTGKNHPFKLPTSMIQGKEALIGLSPDKYVLSRVPVIDKEISLEHDSVSVRIKPGNVMVGKGHYTLTGYEKIRLTNYLSKKSYDKQKAYLRDLLEKGNNKFRLDTFYIVQQQTEKPLIVYYEFTLPDYTTQYDNHTFVNLNFLKDYFDRMALNKRKYSIDFSYKSVHDLSVTLELGPDQKADFVPENIAASNPMLSYDMAYKNAHNKVHFKNRIEFNETTIYAKDFIDVDMIISSYKKNKSHLVSITSK